MNVSMSTALISFFVLFSRCPYDKSICGCTVPWNPRRKCSMWGPFRRYISLSARCVNASDVTIEIKHSFIRTAKYWLVGSRQPSKSPRRNGGPVGMISPLASVRICLDLSEKVRMQNLRRVVIMKMDALSRPYI